MPGVLSFFSLGKVEGVDGELSIDSAAAPPARPPKLWSTRFFTHRFAGRPYFSGVNARNSIKKVKR